MPTVVPTAQEIGSGNGDNYKIIHGGTVEIYGGYVEARGGYHGSGFGAGIGGGDDSPGADVTIYNGTHPLRVVG